MAGRSIEASKVIVRFSAETKKARAEISSMERRLDSLGKRGRSVANFGAQLRGLGEGVNRFGRRITAGGIAAGLPFALAIKQAGEFERSMASIKVNLGDKIFKDTRGGIDKSIKSVGDLNKAYKSLGSTVRGIAKDFPKGPLDVAKTATTLARAGLDRKLIQGDPKAKTAGKGGILRPIVQLSVADTTGADIEEVTQKTLALLKAFDLLKPQKTVGGLDESVSQQADRITRDLATMLKATTMANVSITSLAESMKFAGGIFAKDIKADQTGKAFREVIAVTSILQERLGDASIAGTALRGMMLRLQNPPKKVKDALAEVGFSMETMTDATGQSRLGLVALLRTIEQMRQKVAGGIMSDVEFQVFLGEIFENRQITGALSLIDETADRISSAVSNMKIEGSPQDFLNDFTDELEDNISGAAGRAKSSLQDLAIEIGQAISPQVQGAIAVFADFAKVIKQYVSENPQMVTAFAAATTAALGLGVAVATAGAAVSTLSLAVIASGLVMSKFSSSAAGISTAFAALGSGGSAIARPFRDATKAILAARSATDSLAERLARTPSQVVPPPAPVAGSGSGGTAVTGMTLADRLKQARKEAEKTRKELRKVEEAKKAAAAAQVASAKKVADAEKARARATSAAAFRGQSTSDLRSDIKKFQKKQREEKASAKRRRGVRPVAKKRRAGELALVKPKMPGVKALDLAFLRLAMMADVVSAEFATTSRAFTTPFAGLRQDGPAPKMNAAQSAIIAGRDKAKASRAAELAAAATVAKRTSVDPNQSSSKMTPKQIAAMLASDRKRKGGTGLIVQSKLVEAIRSLERAMALQTAARVQGGFDRPSNSDRLVLQALQQAQASRAREVERLVSATMAGGMAIPAGQMVQGSSGLIAPVGGTRSRGGGASALLQAAGRGLPDTGSMRAIDMNIDRMALLSRELEKVVGPSKTSKIIRALQMTGPLGSLSELARIKGIGPKTVQSIQDSGRFTSRTLGQSAFNPVAGLIGQRPDSNQFTMRGSRARNGEEITLLKAILAAMLVGNAKGITDQSFLFNKLPALLPGGEAGFTSRPSTPMRPSPVTGMREMPLIAATPGNRQAVNMQPLRGGPTPQGQARPFMPLGLPAPGQIFDTENDPRAFGFTPVPGQMPDGRDPSVRTRAQNRRRKLPRLMAKMRSRFMTREAVEMASTRGFNATNMAAMTGRDRKSFLGSPDKPRFHVNRKMKGFRGMAGNMPATIGGAMGVGGVGLAKGAKSVGGASLSVASKGFKGLLTASGKFLAKLTAIGASIAMLGIKIAAVVGAFTLLLTSGNIIGNVFDAFTSSLTSTFSAIKTQVGAVAKVLGSLKFSALGDEAESTGDRINTFMRTLKNSLIIVLGEFAKEVPGMLFSVAKAVVDSIVQAMGALFSFIADSISEFFGGDSARSNKSLGERFESVIDKAVEGARADQAKVTKAADARTAAGIEEQNERLKRITGFQSPELGRQAFEGLRESVQEGFEAGDFTVDDAVKKLEEGADKVTFEALQEEAKSIADSLVTPAEEFKATMDRIEQMRSLGIIDAGQEKSFGQQARTKFEDADPAIKAMKEAAEEQKRAAEALIDAAKSTKRRVNPGFALQEDFKELSKQLSTGVLTLKEFQMAVSQAESSAAQQAEALSEEFSGSSNSKGFGSLGSTSGFFAKFSSLMGADIEDEAVEETKKAMKATTGAMEELKGFVGGLGSVFTDAKSGLGALIDGTKETAKAMLTLGEATETAAASRVSPSTADAAKKAGELAGDAAGKAVGFLAGLIPGAEAKKEKESPAGRGFEFLKDLNLGMFTERGGRGMMASLLSQEGLLEDSKASAILSEEETAITNRNRAVKRAAFLQEGLNKELDLQTSTWRILRNNVLDFMGAIQPNRRSANRESTHTSVGQGYMGSVPLDGARANGGPVAGGGSYVVGERGPELFIPTSSGHILSNGLSKKVDGMFAEGTNDGMFAKFFDDFAFARKMHMDSKGYSDVKYSGGKIDGTAFDVGKGIMGLGGAGIDAVFGAADGAFYGQDEGGKFFEEHNSRMRNMEGKWDISPEGFVTAGADEERFKGRSNDELRELQSDVSSQRVNGLTMYGMRSEEGHAAMLELSRREAQKQRDDSNARIQRIQDGVEKRREDYKRLIEKGAKPVPNSGGRLDLSGLDRKTLDQIAAGVNPFTGQDTRTVGNSGSTFGYMTDAMKAISDIENKKFYDKLNNKPSVNAGKPSDSFAPSAAPSKKGLEYSDINKQLHSLGDSSPRGQLHKMIQAQKTEGGFDPDAPMAQMLADRLTAGAVPTADMSDSKYGPDMPFAKTGTGRFGIPESLGPLTAKFPAMESFGKQGARVHEFTHASSQRPGSKNREISPVMGDMAFAMESFRRQEGKELEGMLTLPGGGQVSASDFLGMARGDGYFNGVPMQEILQNKGSGLRGLLDSMKNGTEPTGSGSSLQDFDPTHPDNHVRPGGGLVPTKTKDGKPITQFDMSTRDRLEMINEDEVAADAERAMNAPVDVSDQLNRPSLADIQPPDLGMPPKADEVGVPPEMENRVAAANPRRGRRQDTNANRFGVRSRAMTGLPGDVQNTSANRFDVRSRAMTGLPGDVQNTNENRMRARLARQREQQQMMQDNAVSFGSFNPNFSRDAAAAGANANNRMAGNGDADLAKDSTIENVISVLEKLITATEGGNTTL